MSNQECKNTAGQTGISGEDIKKRPVPLPPLHEQEDIIKQISTALPEILRQNLNIQHSLTQAAAQRKNILKSAFSDQLVPQNPNDEPASLLLKRIRAERQLNEKLVNQPVKR